MFYAFDFIPMLSRSRNKHHYNLKTIDKNVFAFTFAEFREKQNMFNVLHGCETWSLTLREQHRLRVFENRVLRRIFGPKRDEVTGECRKLHNEELHNLQSSPNIIRQIKSRRMRWTGHVARMGEDRKVYKFLVEKLEGNRPLGRLISRWEEGIRKKNLKRYWLVGWSRLNWLKIGTGDAT
jgi:hypothetical protein